MDTHARTHARTRALTRLPLGPRSQPAPKRQRRVMRELRQLRTALTVEFGSSIFIRYDATRPYIMQFLITGPSDTPYDSGCFLFHLYCPPAYASTNPKVHFMTTGGGTVRFNPNLYNTGKVCLSLLGTWQGQQWEASKSTLSQVLVSIQAQILGVELPVYNEPGWEKYQGTAQGRQLERESGNGGLRLVREGTLRWAVLDMLQRPPKGFESVVYTHFFLKRAQLLAVYQGWIDEAVRLKEHAHAARLQATFSVVKTVLAGITRKGSQ